jgi:aminoglycoside phosphotransferase (APT) family kinase protein
VSRRRPRRILDRDLDDHPAVAAWRALEPASAPPVRIEVYSDRPQWMLYALSGVGPDGSTVFAKRRLQSMAATERTVYERVLPDLPVATPRYYGCVEDGEFVWLLLQAVEGAPYDESDPGHLGMAARWVAAMHVATAPLERPASLPDAGPDRYLAHLHGGRDRLVACLAECRFLDGEGRLTLEGLVDRLNGLETRWDQIRAQCDAMPTALVHADFRSKNVFVRHDGAGLVAFDWETAGWGPPAADLTKIDVPAYFEAVRDGWKHVDLDGVARWAKMGSLFQALAAIDWKGTELDVDSDAALGPPLISLELWRTRLDEVLPFV